MPRVTLRAVSELGVALVLRVVDTLDDLGIVHVPGPAEIGDLCAFAHGPPWRIVDLLPATPNATVVAALVRRATFALSAR